MKTTPFHFDLPTELHKKLKEFAKKEYTSMAAVIRKAIKYYIDGGKK